MDSPGPAHALLAKPGPGDAPEPSIQGYVPPSDQSFIEHGYRCNLELVGSYADDGFLASLAWFGDCVYADTGYLTTDPEWDQLEGVRVIDAADPKHPKRTALLQSPAMALPKESLKVNQRRGLLAAVQSASAKEMFP